MSKTRQTVSAKPRIARVPNDENQPRHRNAARLMLVIGVTAIGFVFAVGALTTAFLDIETIGADPTLSARAGFVVLLILGLVASVMMPFAIANWAYPQHRSELEGATIAILIVALGLFVLALL